MNVQHDSAPILTAASLGRRAPKGEKWLLRDVDLELRAGERVALVGPSGSGKSTLLRALAQLDPIDEGELRFCEKAIAGAAVPGYRSRVVYLHQRSALGDGVVEEALRRPFDWRAHSDKAFDRKRIVRWLEEIGRGAEFLDLRLENLSVGEAQMTVLLRAMQLDPQILLLDEPTSGLDADSVRLVESLVVNWLEQDAGNRAFVWVTHDSGQAARIADDIWRMEDGRLDVIRGRGTGDRGQGTGNPAPDS